MAETAKGTEAEDDERTSGEGGTAMVMMLAVATMLMKKTIKRVYRYELLMVMMVMTIGLERLYRYE